MSELGHADDLGDRIDDGDEESEEEDNTSDDDLEDGEDADDDYEEEKQANERPIQMMLMEFYNKAIVPGKTDWGKDGSVWGDYPELNQPSDLNGKNILHLLIEGYTQTMSKTTKAHIRQIIEKITARYPELVQKRATVSPDTTPPIGQTPLFSALTSCDSRLVDAVVGSCAARSTGGDDDTTKSSRKASDGDPLSQAIGVHCTVEGRTENALHYALRASSSVITPKTLKLMVTMAPVAAIASADKDGFTPLHHAVSYGSSNKAQYDIVKKLVKRGDTQRLINQERAVLDFRTNKDQLSAYQYHIRTKDQFKEPMVTTKTVSIRTKRPLKNTEPEKRGVADISKDRELEWVEREKEKEKERERERSRREKGKGASTFEEKKKLAFAKIGKEVPASLEDSSHSALKLKRTPTGNLEEQGAPHEETAEERKRKRDEWSDKIAMELKIQYLRTRSHQNAISLLYGKNPQDIQICFDYQGAPEIDAESFIASFANVKFDSVLKYVAFPPIHVKNHRPSPRSSSSSYNNNSNNNPRLGRSDLLFFFRWLRENKGVKRILKVIVEDSGEVPHSDQAIEEALKPFGVEILDWSKPDLDPETILNASKDLTEVVLHWGGNNAVLRAWSEPEGLPKLPNLKTIRLFVDNTLESEERTKQNVLNFEHRIESNIKRIRLVGSNDGFPSSRNGPSSGLVTSGARENLSTPSHRWLKATDAFAQRIFNVWEKIIKERRDTPTTPITMGPKTELPEIVVALIDDGVDTTQDELVGRILPGRTFGIDGERVRPWHASETGHGTIMANMICRVCPMVKIYPIRLKTGQRRTIDPQSAVDAINAAVDRGVDIISMSWTVSTPRDELQVAFNAAIERAINNSILMFCSSKDSGHVDDSYYPAGYRPDSVIKVGAANPTGLPYDWAGSLDKLDFIFPGVEVVQRHPGPPQGVEKLDENTGSSIATALGAGLASLIMYCAHIGHMYGNADLTENVVQQLHNRDVMVEAIRSFGRSTSKETGGKFIEVWRKLEGKTAELAQSSILESRKKVAALARDLINISN